MAYINAQDVAAIRTELKQAFPNWKFGVRKGSGGLSVDVTVKQGTIDFIESYCAHKIDPVQAEYTRKNRAIQISKLWRLRRTGAIQSSPHRVVGCQSGC